ncbi:LCP family protein [Granulicoccus phenolivorans]|uniref:LCP family protein n=1 Tax=Granulicoccus phenolivorans TaxID=266854 RepID=UPI0004120F06|nr:LCP family protein [Granulicoccus phenolivorans]
MSDRDLTARTERLHLRRAWGRLALTLLLPGSAQLASGNKRLGRVAVRVYAVLWGLLLLYAVLFLVNRGAAVALITARPVTIVVSIVLVLAGIGAALLTLDAWRVSRPLELTTGHRRVFAGVALVLALVLTGGSIASASVMTAQADFFSTVFKGGGDTRTKAGRYNVLLLGGDAGTGREGLRPDSMTIASIDANTGRTVLLGLPRNMEDIQFPDDSPMKKLYPGKFECANHQCMLNAVYTKASEHRELYPGVKDPGAQATKEAVEWVTGLEINYYVLIDLDGFSSLIDSVGGIRVDVNKRVPVGGGSTVVNRYIEPGPNQLLDGHNALWFARSRHDSTDYERMARQKCVITAMLNQLDPLTVMTHFQAIAAAGKGVVETDAPTSELDKFVDLAVKAKQTKVSSLSFVPPLVQPGQPDFTVIRETTKQRIQASEQSTDQPLPAGNAPDPSATPEPGKAAGIDDVAQICKAV